MAGEGDTGRWVGHKVLGPDGKKIGTVEHVYRDRETERPSWAAVRSGGLLRKRLLYVPLADAWPGGAGTLHVGVTRDQTKDAPSFDPRDEMSADVEERLRRHYGEAAGVGGRGAEREAGGEEE